MYIVLAIVIFGLLILVHELGHFVAAKRLGVKVNEFAMGMGPKLFSFTRGETTYALRALPLGGACVMEGEDEDNLDPRSFNAQAPWKRIIILAAGAFMNLVFGLIIVMILQPGSYDMTSTTITGFALGFPYEGEQALMVGDKIHSINGSRTYYAEDFLMYMDFPDAKDGIIDLVIVRNWEKIKLNDFELIPREYLNDRGELVLRYGLAFQSIEPTLGERTKYCFYTTYNYARMVKIGLEQLVTGQASLKDLSGPVGIVATINETAQNPKLETVGARVEMVLTLGAFIAVNLAVMNLLPIPALDGGRIVGVIITWIIEKITKKRPNPKYEGYIHTGGFALLMLLMVIVLVSDVVRLI